jgi:hypothetical protein
MHRASTFYTQSYVYMTMENNNQSYPSSCGDSSSDSSWRQSSSDEEDSDDDDESVWKETPLQASRIRLITDRLDDIMTNNYGEETTVLHCHIQSQVDQLRAGVPSFNKSGIDKEQDKQLTTNEIFNALFHTTLVYEFIAMMNMWLSRHNGMPTDYNEFQIVVRLIFWFCYYGTGPCVMTKNIVVN